MRTSHKLILLAILTVIAGGVWGPQLIARLTPAKNLSRPLGPRYYCETCGWHFDAAPDLLPPVKCPKCKKDSAMATPFGAGASLPEFIRCKQCQARFPSQLYRWPPEEKVRWEKKFDQLGDGQFLTSAEAMELQQSRLVKTSTADWMKWVKFQWLPAAQQNAQRCLKCGNTSLAKFEYAPELTGTAGGRR